MGDSDEARLLLRRVVREIQASKTLGVSWEACKQGHGSKPRSSRERISREWSSTIALPCLGYFSDTDGPCCGLAEQNKFQDAWQAAASASLTATVVQAHNVNIAEHHTPNGAGE